MVKADLKAVFAAAFFAAAAFSPAARAEEGDYIVGIREGAPLPEESDVIISLGEGNYLVKDFDTAQGLAENAEYIFEDFSLEIPVPDTEGYIEDQCSGAELFSDAEPDDPFLDSQWYLREINAPSAWERGLRGEGVTVAVIDSGVNIDHSDIDTERVTSFLNCISGEDATDIYDKTSIGHGTFVSGIIGATQNNALCVTGIAPEANLIPIKVTNSTSFSASMLFTGLDKAISMGCDIINMSMGITSESETASILALKRYINKAYAQNIIVVAAAGNNGADAEKGGYYSYPASFDHVISVGSLGRPVSSGDGDGVYKTELRLRQQSGSYYTYNAALREPSLFTQHNDRVTCAAPGWQICGLSSTAADGIKYNSGTSFAAPVVASAAALAKQLWRDMTPDDFERILTATARDVYDEGYDIYTGYGELDIDALLRYIENGIGLSNFSCSLSLSGDNTLSAEFSFEPRVYGTKIIAAMYSGDRLASVRELNVAAGDAPQALEIPADGDRLAVMVWDEDMSPLREAINISIDEIENN